MKIFSQLLKKLDMIRIQNLIFPSKIILYHFWHNNLTRRNYVGTNYELDRIVI
mgnify:CR=1 FL=1